jgi:hypothetical protein
MTDMANYLKNKLLNLTLSGTAYAGVDDPYVSLWISDPTDDESGAEVSGGSYARTQASFATASGTTGQVATDADVTFPTATGAWGTVAYIGLHESATGTGNMIYHTALDISKTIDAGDIFKISTGDLTVELD